MSSITMNVTQPGYMSALGDITNPFGVASPWFFTYDGAWGLEAPAPMLMVAASVIGYLLVAFIIAPATRPTTQVGVDFMRGCRYYHNLAMFAFSAVACFGTLTYMWQQGEFESLESICCRSLVPNWLSLLNLAFLASKVYEWVDTAFLVWGAKDFSKLNFLHVYHHATTFWLFAIVSNFPGCAKMGMILNGGVHTLMYAHYARPFPKALVPMITGLQLAQLFYAFYLWVMTPGTCGGRFHDFKYETHALEYWTPFAFVPVYIFFFLRFFVRRYVFRTSHHHSKKRSTVVKERTD